MRNLKVLAIAVFAVIVLSAVKIAPVYAAGGNSPYVTPDDTGYNLDIVGIAGAVMYGMGLVFVGYGKFFNKLSQKAV